MLKTGLQILIVSLTLSATVGANDECTNDMELLRRCQDNLALVQKRADKLEASANSMVPKSELDLAQAATKKAFEKIAELEETVMTADSKALKLQEATEAAEAENTKAKSEISSLRKELSQFKSSFKMADTEALKLRKRAEQAEHDLRSLSVHHSSAWLPHWLEKSVVKYIADAHVVLSKGFSSANHTAYRASVASHAAWTQHVDPHVRQGVNFVKAKAVLAFAEGTKRLESAGVRLPTSMVTAKESLRRFFHAASTSDTTAQLLATLHSVGSWVHKQAHTVVTELEVLVVQTANKHPSLRLVAEKPLSMVAVYLILCFPLIAIIMPMMASRRSEAALSYQRPNSSMPTHHTTAAAGSTSKGAAGQKRKSGRHAKMH